MKRSRLGVVAVALPLALGGCSPESAPRDFNTPEIAAARAEAAEQMTARLDAFEDRMPDLHRTGETGWIDTCSPGQRNWKIQDPWAYSCTSTYTRVYTFGTEATSHCHRIRVAVNGRHVEPGSQPGGSFVEFEVGPVAARDVTPTFHVMLHVA